MKPVKLEFEGINSFSEHTIIDFENLVKNGLFGIFGDTGSGKSTILDCINFALYGNVERSRIMTDIINYRCDAAKVKFVFDILSEGRRKTYTAERSIKKDKSGTHKAFLYENDGTKELCIADKASAVEKKIVEILGVEAEDFRKCIALPQGEFAQFVKSAPRDRLALIERLFNLSRYGDRLKEKLNARQAAADAVYQKYSGVLQGYEGITQDALNEAYSGVKSKKALLDKKNKSAKNISEKCDKLKILIEKRRQLEEAGKKLAEAERKTAEADGLRKDFAVLSVCADAVGCEEENNAKLEHIKGLTASIAKCEGEISSAEREEEYLDRQIAAENFDGNIAECLKTQALYGSVSSATEKLTALNGKLNQKRAEYRKKEEEKLKLEYDRTSAERALFDAEKKLEKVSDSDMAGLNEKLKWAVLKEEYSYSLDYFANFKNGLKIFEDGSPLYKYASGEAEKKVKEYSDRVRAVADTTPDGVDGQFDELRRSGKEREERQKAVSACSERLAKIDAAIEIKNNELKVSAKEGAEVRAQIDEVKKEIATIFGEGTDPAAARKNNDDKLERLQKRKAELNAKLDGIKNRKNGLLLALERDRSTLAARNEEAENSAAKLKELLKKAGRRNTDECRQVLARFENIPSAEKFLKDLDGETAALKSKVEELKKTDGILQVTDEEYTEAERERAAVSEEIIALTREVAVWEASAADLEKRLNEKKVILKEFSETERERNLLSALKEATKNNKFMEFIANEYLYDISRTASVTLLKLTDGRYFLTYKDNNFSVGDNFDCGSLRGVNTLSGGETFLVSLSLALALSETICSKSMRNIEFFFLDEGFGTLDSSLVEVVMSALEKLKSSNFTIGVISHVEELKHRIDSKITVNKATESHGSTVSVSC